MNIYKQYKLYKQNRKILEVKFIDSKSQDKNYAIIIPYRNDKENERKKQFDKFIKFAKKTFKDNVKIIIIEQSDFENKFNRGKLLNIGVKLSKNIEHYIFHDIEIYTYCSTLVVLYVFIVLLLLVSSISFINYKYRKKRYIKINNNVPPDYDAIN